MIQNASIADKSIVDEPTYGEKTAHSSIVSIEEQDNSQHKPGECGCNTDQYEKYACRYRGVLVAIGGTVVLQAVIDAPTPTVNAERSISESLAERLRTHAGTTTEEPNVESSDRGRPVPDACTCVAFPVDLPCWPCYRHGQTELAA